MTELNIRPPDTSRAVSALRQRKPISDGWKCGVVTALGNSQGFPTVDVSVGAGADAIRYPSVRFDHSLQLAVGHTVWFFQNGPTDAYVISRGSGQPGSASTGIQNPRGTYSDWSHADPGTPGFTTVDIPLTVQVDPSPSAVFFSTQFVFYQRQLDGNSADGYIGIQTNSSIGGQDGLHIALMAIWGALDAVGPAVAETFSGEGDGYHVAIAYPWRSGTKYVMRVTNQGPPAGKTDAAGPWLHGYAMEVPIPSTDPMLATLIGAVQVPTSYGIGLGTFFTNFTEHYGPKPCRCEEITYTRAVFGQPLGDGAVPTSVNPHMAPDGCTNSSSSTTSLPFTGVLHEIGIR